MDKITDFFKEIKDRLSNPFISSFLFSWLVTNWRLPVALFGYDKEDYKAMGFKGFIDYCSTFKDWTELILIPLLVALFYSFAFPIFRNAILITSAWYKSWGSKWVRKVSKGGMIEIEKYIFLRESYEERQKQLEVIIKQESAVANKNVELQTELNDLKQENSALKVELGESNSRNSKLEIENGDISHRIINLATENYDIKQKREEDGELLRIYKDAEYPTFINGYYDMIISDKSTNQVIEQKVIHIADPEFIEIKDIQVSKHILIFSYSPINNWVQMLTTYDSHNGRELDAYTFRTNPEMTHFEGNIHGKNWKVELRKRLY